jgi:phage baseplate assembly protein W
MSRQFRRYSDIDAVFAANPITRDISLRTDENAVKFAIKNLILTRNFERPFNSSIGSQLNQFLFEIMDDTTIIVMKQVIANCIANHEPRVIVTSINIDAMPDANEVVVSINFNIVNTTKPYNITFALERTR